MLNGIHPVAAAEPEADAAMQALLTSAALRRATTLHRLLQYLWENRSRDLTEYTIATEVLQRKPDFDPKIDSVVRVHVLRLRQKLKEYYQGEGAQCAVRFTIPSGSLGLHIELVPAAAQGPQEEIVETAGQPAAGRRWMWPLVCTMLAILAIAGWYKALRPPGPPAERLPTFWAAALGNGKPSRLVLPTPVFLQWPGRSLRARDFRANEFEDMVTSSELQPLIERYGPPSLSQSYSVMGSSIAAARLTQYLSVRGAQVNVAPESQLAFESFSSENLIFLGIPHTSRWLAGLLESCNFQVESNGESIVNSRPRPGEPERFAQANHSPTRRVTPHLFAVLPGRGQSTRTLVLTGQTSALASYLMSPSGIDAIHADWIKLDRPDYVELVVLAETEGDTLVKASLAGFRAVQPTR